MWRHDIGRIINSFVASVAGSMKLTKFLLLVVLGVVSWTIGFAAPAGESDASGSVYESEEDVKLEPVQSLSLTVIRCRGLQMQMQPKDLLSMMLNKIIDNTVCP